MGIADILMLGFFSGLFSVGMAMNFGTPKNALPICFVCGALAIIFRDLLTNAGFNLTAASSISAFIVSLIALYTTQKKDIAYVTIVSCSLPLGAAMPFFKMVIGLVKIPSTSKDQLSSVINETVFEFSEVLTIYIAIIWAGICAIFLFRLLGRRKKVV